MKKRYSLQGKDIFDVKDNNDLVRQIRYRSIMFGNQSEAEYRKGFAKRHLQTTGQKIDPSSNDTFVRDLIKFKEIKEVKPKKSSKTIGAVSRTKFKKGDKVKYLGKPAVIKGVVERPGSKTEYHVSYKSGTKSVTANFQPESTITK